jgi:UDP-glucose 4-epimerase
MHNLKDIDAIFHEAAIANVKKSIEDPMAINEANVVGTLKVLEFALKNDISKFLFASSAAVYGEIKEDKLPASEEMLCLPLSPYGASKLACEKYLHAYGKTYGIKTVAFRYANVYGPRQTVNDYSGVITIFIKNILNGRTPVIYGDGYQVRDFVHVSDIAEANLTAASTEDISAEVFNVGSGSSISINKLLKILSKIFFSDPHFIKAKYLPERPGDIHKGIVSIEKIKRKLNYIPSMSIERGLTDLVQKYTLVEEKREQISSNKEKKTG